MSLHLFSNNKADNEFENIKKSQSIDSQIFVDKILESRERYRYYYMHEIPLSKIQIDQKIVVREKDEYLINKLKPQIESEGLIEPLTVLDMGNSDFLLLAGQHRYHVCKELQIVKVPAKIYLNLDLAERLTLGYMSNEARKDPPAGRKYGALNEIFHETKNKLEQELGRNVTESEVISQMYMAKNPRIAKVKTKEIILGMITDDLINNPNGLVKKHQFISVRQVPKSKIINMIRDYNNKKTNLFPLLTSKNAFYGIAHLVRTTPVTGEDEKSNNDYRENEKQNIQMLFDLLITKHIQPWMEKSSPEVDAAMNICKRHIFETLCKLIAKVLRNRDFDIQTKNGSTAPLYTNKKIPWSLIFDEIQPFFTPDFLNHPNIEKERGLDLLWNRVEYFVLQKPGRMPSF